jgi:lipoprotein signal peptidase
MEKLAFTMMNLFDVRVIVAIMCVLMEELLCQAVMG